MFGDCWRRRRRDPPPPPPPGLDPVLLVSGMGGSILNARSKKTGLEIRVWVRILLANFAFKKNLWSMYNSSTGYVESMNPNVEIRVPDDDHGLYAIDILDPSLWAKLSHLTEVYHFHDMIDMLVGCGYEKGTTLFGYGYDFRQSNRVDKAMDDLKMKLQIGFKASGGKKLNIISHSMGGLLVRCFLSLQPDVFEKYVNKWICIACPFQGAPGCIYDSLLTGLQFVYGFVSFFFVFRWTMHQLLVECPSIHEMLPNPEFKWKVQPLIQVWRKKSEEGHLVVRDVYDPTTCVGLFEAALKNNEMKYSGKSVALPFNFSVYTWAANTRQVLNNAKLPDSVTFYNIFGTSIDSPFDVCYGSESSPIGDMSEVCHTMPQYTYVDGDGTVPSESAEADGFMAAARVGVKGDHRGLLSNKKVFKLLKHWLGVSEKSNSVSTSKVMDILVTQDPIQYGGKDFSLG